MITYEKLVLFGDSIFQFAVNPNGGLVPLLMDRYQRQLDVVVRGFSGYNTEWCRELVKPILDGLGPGKIAAIVLFLGTNDAAAQGSLQHVSVERYRENILAMVTEMREKSPKVILVGPAIMDEKNPNQEPGLRTNRALFSYSRACKDVAEQLRLPFVDLANAFYSKLGVTEFFTSMPGDADYTGSIDVSSLVPDGLHFSGEAYRVFYDALLPALNIEPQVTIMPLWRTVTGLHDIRDSREILERSHKGSSF